VRYSCEIITLNLARRRPWAIFAECGFEHRAPRISGSTGLTLTTLRFKSTSPCPLSMQPFQNEQSNLEPFRAVPVGQERVKVLIVHGTCVIGNVRHNGR
jgi:hypothetical protein